ncbi:MAG: hypothetical protein K5821_05470 [Nitrobacter sp.]|uniref:hypothetical protein n=1 Tax=Nitrobacter sp. TaxID=29420 RepID=UPI00261A70F5|nr:hypothetical protein [Nitrobacter sp.]MCV0385867.1 hypothetical protein [Nitrobacter sp.]
MSNVVTFPRNSTSRGQLPFTSEDQEAPQKGDWRARMHVQTDIENHRAARRRYAEAVAWIAAAESANLPAVQIEAAKQDLVKLHAEVDDCARMLLIVMPTDVKGLIELLLYLERNFTVLPQAITYNGGGTTNSLAFDLLRTVRLSLREIAKGQRSSS